MSSNRKLKLKLYELDPHCHWCKQKTVLTDVKKMNKRTINPLMATVDHVYSRYDLRRFVKKTPNEVRKVLACFNCNNTRARQETKQLSRQELYLRGKGFSFNPKGKPIFMTAVNSYEEVLAMLNNRGIVVSSPVVTQ